MSVLQNFYKTTITRNWTATTGDFNVSVAPTPTSGWLVISPNNSTLREIVYYSAVGSNAYGAFVTISNIGDRGLGGTTAQTHTIGETVRMNVTAEHWAEMTDAIDAIVAAGASNASTTVRGIVEEATDSELILGTETGSTTAKLFTPVSLNGYFSKTVSVTSADLLAINTTPLEIIPAPGVGKVISLESIVYSFTYNSVAYTGGNTLFPVWSGNTTNIFGDEGNAAIANAIITATSSSVNRRSFSSGSVSTPMLSNTAIKLYSSGNFATGNSTMKLFITYKIITL